MKRPITRNSIKPSGPVLKSLDEQKSEFTSEGAPPPGTVASPTHSNIAPALPRTDSPEAETGASPPMQQAHRDLARGLKDTDRGAESGRTYQKLKSSKLAKH